MKMKTLGNIIWLIFGGFLISAATFIAGVLLCVTIIFIPFGIKLFKLARLYLWPFGKTVYTYFEKRTWLNVIFAGLFGGAAGAFTHLMIGALLCITIIGIPFAKQHFKIARYCVAPFGAVIVK